MRFPHDLRIVSAAVLTITTLLVGIAFSLERDPTPSSPHRSPATASDNPADEEEDETAGCRPVSPGAVAAMRARLVRAQLLGADVTVPPEGLAETAFRRLLADHHGVTLHDVTAIADYDALVNDARSEVSPMPVRAFVSRLEPFVAQYGLDLRLIEQPDEVDRVLGGLQSIDALGATADQRRNIKESALSIVHALATVPAEFVTASGLTAIALGDVDAGDDDEWYTGAIYDGNHRIVIGTDRAEDVETVLHEITHAWDDIQCGGETGRDNGWAALQPRRMYDDEGSEAGTIRTLESPLEDTDKTTPDTHAFTINEYAATSIGEDKAVTGGAVMAHLGSIAELQRSPVTSYKATFLLARLAQDEPSVAAYLADAAATRWTHLAPSAS